MKLPIFIVTIIVTGALGSSEPSNEVSRHLLDKLTKHRDDLASLESYGHEKLTQLYRKSKDAFLDHVFTQVHAAKNSRPNSKKLHEVLDRIPHNSFFSWSACVSIKTVITNLTALIKDAKEEFTGTETLICDGIQEAENCDGNILSKVVCLSDTFTSVIKRYLAQFKGISYYLSELSDLYNTATTATKKCFSLWSVKTSKLIQSALNEHF